MMKARDVMTTPVRSVPPGLPVAMAADILRDSAVSSAPVIDDDGRLVGLVTRSAVASASVGVSADRHAHWLHARQRAPISVRDVMTTPVESMTPGADMAHILELMLDKHLDWVPIVDGHTLVGAITPAELAIAEHSPIPSTP